MPGRFSFLTGCRPLSRLLVALPAAALAQDVQISTAALESIPGPEPVVSVSTAGFATDASSASVTSRPWRKVEHTRFAVPERLEFVIRWGVVTAGKSNLIIEGIENVKGRDAYRLVSEANSTGMVDGFYRVRDRNVAWLDVESLTSVRYTRNIREGGYRLEESVEFDQEAGRWSRDSFRIDKNRKETKEGDLPRYALDIQSSLYYVRTLPLEVGKSFTMDVQSSDKSYPLEVRVKKRETIKVPAGTFDTFLVEPLLRAPGLFVSKGKKLEVWMTADERRIPVRMRSEVFFGHVAAELVSRQP